MRRRRGARGVVRLVTGGAAVVLCAGVAACTTEGSGGPVTTTPATATTTPSTTTSTTPSTTPSGTTSAAPSDAASGSTTTSQTSVAPTPTGSPSYFTPDPSSYAMSGRIAVAPALQDPFSNLLRRGALHDQPVTLDVVGTPDYPVTPAPGVTILFGTCKCADRGSGLRLTVADATGVRVEPNGDVAIRGTFRPAVTASDAITLRPA